MALTISAHRPVDRAEEILTPEALAFIEELHQRFAATRGELLKARAVKREDVARTGRLDFLPETRDIREGDWSVAAGPRSPAGPPGGNDRARPHRPKWPSTP